MFSPDIRASENLPYMENPPMFYIRRRFSMIFHPHKSFRESSIYNTDLWVEKLQRDEELQKIFYLLRIVKGRLCKEELHQVVFPYKSYVKFCGYIRPFKHLIRKVLQLCKRSLCLLKVLFLQEKDRMSSRHTKYKRF